MSSTDSVTVTVSVKTLKGLDESLTFLEVSHPIEFDDVARRIEERGYPRPIALAPIRPVHNVTITAGQSKILARKGAELNLNQPLLHFYNKLLVPLGAASDENKKPDRSESETPVGVSEARICHVDDGETQVELGNVKIRFHRTLRVPDNDQTHALPPNMGTFDLFNVANVADRLPKSVLSKGGMFLSMYQREAMWMSFMNNSETGSNAHALKISVGGINALTGLPMSDPSGGKQDYLAINDENSQLWLDGISTEPGVVRQFVAMPLGKGYTIEGQLTGREEKGGLQIDVYPQYPTTVSFTFKGRPLSLYKTPRQLGLVPGDQLQMIDLAGKPCLIARSCSLSVLASNVVFTAIYNRDYGQAGNTTSSVIVTVIGMTGRSIPLRLHCQWTDTIASLKAQIEDSVGITPDYQRLMYAGEQLYDDMCLSETDYSSHGAIELCLRVLGGGRGPDYDNLQAGFAAGGRISQKINRDPLPPLAYDQTKGSRLHVTIINAVHFASVTGLPNPVSPISAKTYNKHGLPWYKLYDEHIPHANNATTPTPLSDVRSVAQLDRDRASRGSCNVQLDCGYCDYEMATIRLQPCGHGMCDSCSTVDACPTCQRKVTSRKRFAVSMSTTGNEDSDCLDSHSLSERIVMLKSSARKGAVASLKLSTHSVSPLCRAS